MSPRRSLVLELQIPGCVAKQSKQPQFSKPIFSGPFPFMFSFPFPFTCSRPDKNKNGQVVLCSRFPFYSISAPPLPSASNPSTHPPCYPFKPRWCSRRLWPTSEKRKSKGKPPCKRSAQTRPSASRAGRRKQEPSRWKSAGGRPATARCSPTWPGPCRPRRRRSTTMRPSPRRSCDGSSKATTWT